MISAIPVSGELTSTLPDLTDERAGTHAIQCVVEDVEIALRNVLRCRLVRLPSRRSIDADARQLTWSVLQAAGFGGGEVPSHVLVSSPGLVVRPGGAGDGAREASHELSVLRIRTGRRLTADSVDAMVHTVVSAVLPDRSFRTEEVCEPDATDAVRVLVDDDRGGAVLVGGCGVVGGSVLGGAQAEATTRS
jgi:hypothetical protein